MANEEAGMIDEAGMGTMRASGRAAFEALDGHGGRVVAGLMVVDPSGAWAEVMTGDDGTARVIGHVHGQPHVNVDLETLDAPGLRAALDTALAPASSQERLQPVTSPVSRMFDGGAVALGYMRHVCEEAARRKLEITATGVEVGDDAIIPWIRVRRDGREACVRVWSDGASVNLLEQEACERVDGHSPARLLDAALQVMEAQPPTEQLTPAQTREVFVAGLGRSRPDGLT
jgi:hypothetical protein